MWGRGCDVPLSTLQLQKAVSRWGSLSLEQGSEMSILLHGAKSSNQILPNVSRWGSLSLDQAGHHGSPKMCTYCSKKILLQGVENCFFFTKHCKTALTILNSLSALKKIQQYSSKLEHYLLGNVSRVYMSSHTEHICSISGEVEQCGMCT